MIEGLKMIVSQRYTHTLRTFYTHTSIGHVPDVVPDSHCTVVSGRANETISCNDHFVRLSSIVASGHFLGLSVVKVNNHEGAVLRDRGKFIRDWTEA